MNHHTPAGVGCVVTHKWYPRSMSLLQLGSRIRTPKEVLAFPCLLSVPRGVGRWLFQWEKEEVVSGGGRLLGFVISSGMGFFL